MLLRFSDLYYYIAISSIKQKCDNNYYEERNKDEITTGWNRDLNYSDWFPGKYCRFLSTIVCLFTNSETQSYSNK